MLTLSLLSLVVAVLPAFGQQFVYNAVHNATSIEGTWSTGSGAVVTGPDSTNPANMTFVYPKNTGRSYSFTDLGNWEQLDYRMAANATNPNCITAVITWQHGTFQFLSNGSLLLTPFESDGFQQVQDPCAAVSNQIARYSQEILFSQWRIFPLTSGGNHLNLYEFDGTPVAPMNLVFSPPNMHPTATLISTATSTGSSTSTSTAKRDLAARSGASKSASLMLGSVTAMAGLGALMVFL